MRGLVVDDVTLSGATEDETGLEGGTALGQICNFFSFFKQSEK